MDYERKPTDQKTFSLLEDVFVAFPKIPMSIEEKDRTGLTALHLQDLAHTHVDLSEFCHQHCVREGQAHATDEQCCCRASNADPMV